MANCQSGFSVMFLSLECLLLFLFSARSERYHHLASDEDEETNDEESSLEIRQFSSWSHRFSKVRPTCWNTSFKEWSAPLVRQNLSAIRMQIYVWIFTAMMFILGVLTDQSRCLFLGTDPLEIDPHFHCYRCLTVGPCSPGPGFSRSPFSPVGISHESALFCQI